MNSRLNDLRYIVRAALIIVLVAVLTTISARLRADTGTCNGGSITLPFTDVPRRTFSSARSPRRIFSG